MLPFVLLFASCVLSFAIEAALGFGATLVALALASLFWGDLRTLVPMLVIPGMAFSLSILVTRWRAVDIRFLTRTILPWMTLGLPIGLALVSIADLAWLKRAYGAFLVVLALYELRKLSRSAHGVIASANPVSDSLAERRSAGLLLLGGIVHGMFTTSGPLLAYVANRSLADRDRFRATLAAAFLALNIVFLSVAIARGSFNHQALAASLPLLPAAGLGLIAGRLIAGRLPQRLFTQLVYALLLFAGVVFCVRG